MKLARRRSRPPAAYRQMITAGTHEVVVRADQWTIATRDNSLAAHFEYTVAITDDRPKILTAAPVPAR